MSGLVKGSADARSKTIGQNFRVRAWVTFNGSSLSGTITDHNHGNVSSITVHSKGVYTINFTTEFFPYAVAGISNGNASNGEDLEIMIDSGTSPTSSACKIFAASGHKPGVTAGAVNNPTLITVIFVG